MSLSFFERPERQKYDPTPVINALRQAVDAWRELPNPTEWAVTSETVIWFVEVAPKFGAEGRRFLDHLGAANEEASVGAQELGLTDEAWRP
jgi:type III restriction enzyme